MSLRDTLCDVLEPVGRPLLREHSVKVIGDEIRDGRFLVSFPRAALGPGPSRVLRGMLARLGAPDAGIAALDPLQSRASVLHFGYEPEARAEVLKCYLEFPADDRPAPGQAFLALKWTPRAHVLSDYRDPGPLGPAERRARIRALLPEGPVSDALQTLAGLPADLTLLEVTEPGSARRSLDLNLTPLSARVADHAALLRPLLGPGAGALLERLGAARLDHVAAGTARDGQAFATLYHGVHRVHGSLKEAAWTGA
ncbi:hypothetical protein KM176_10795 [Pseudooceanicola sp. CBS1P-1]|uniref:Uncharacterized protein n=1 Tax=Pseudooceanicola albus TaxID=2692189 RepID=A0A6L7G945_9RHOB|nr:MULTISPECIES: hypothetical protein [Pseudooceanicola]MBT9384346.1 hypothetical protein [Pseudooceanicola endophyticus]MXN19916.1 hypothetical protein [Pseudooceanicola albus]